MWYMTKHQNGAQIFEKRDIPGCVFPPLTVITRKILIVIFLCMRGVLDLTG